MTETFADRHGIYGVIAQFETPEQVLEAANRAYAAGYRKMDAYTPMPIDGLAEAVGIRRNWVAPIVLFFGLCGGCRRLWVVVVDFGDRLSAQCGGPSLQ